MTPAGVQMFVEESGPLCQTPRSSIGRYAVTPVKQTGALVRADPNRAGRQVGPCNLLRHPTAKPDSDLWASIRPS
jgi:hypothetical protein